MKFTDILRRYRGGHNGLNRHGWLIVILCLGAIALASVKPSKGIWAAQDDIWQDIDRAAPNVQSLRGRGQRVVRLNSPPLTQVLARALPESAGPMSQSPAVLSLPIPDGTFMQFSLVESPVMEPALASRFPEIKTYRGQGIDNPTAVVHCDWSPRGFHAMIANKDTTITIHPLQAEDLSTYVSYDSQHQEGRGDDPGCVGELPTALTSQVLSAPSAAPNAVPTGATLRTYRIVVATTQEYTNTPSLGGGTVSSALASINTWLNNLNLIYIRELSVRFVLVASNTNVIYREEPDPFSNGDTFTMLGQARSLFRDHIGVANYDIGHVLGTNSGGQAYVSAVCNNNEGPENLGPYKGGGVSGMQGVAGNSLSLGLLAHEIGHQFGARHTFNHNQGACSPNRSPQAAWESGDGLTIMGYTQACYPHSISGSRALRFHAGTLNEIGAYLSSLGSSCATVSPTGNNVPVVNAGADYSIPRNTPFIMTASASDADPQDALNLTYCWEQVDAGGASYGSPPYSDTGDPPGTTRPIFRPFGPVPEAARTFPSLKYILNNANVAPELDSNGLQSAEYLPTVARALNFSCTVRDGRGGINGDSVVLSVAGNAGPFLVTQPNTSVTLTGGISQTISWSVNNTNIAPVNCSSVRILLSTDGGNTFPITLAANTPNDGAEVVTLPFTLVTTAARIKVEAVGNIFFDISDADFTILPGGTCPAVSGAGGLSVQIGTIGTSVSVSGANFSGVNAVRFANGAGDVNAAFTVVSGNLITTTVPAGAVTGPITISKPGCSDAHTSTFTVPPCAASLLSIDDGSFEQFWSISGPTSYWVNRITPASYPATLSAVSIFNGDIPVGSNMTVMAGTNTDGDSDINQTVFQTRDVTAMALGQFTTYSVPLPITINSGDFVVGFRFAAVSGVFPGAQDTTPPAQNRSFFSSDGTNFFNISDQNPGNWGIRGVVYLSGSISPTARSFGGAGGAGTVAVTSQSGCTWSAVSNVSWIRITSGASGTGNGTVGYSVETNTGAARNGVLTIAGQTFTVNQSGNDGCEYSLNAAGNSYGSAGGSGSVNVTAPAGCGWNAETSASWVTLTSASGTGNGVLNYSVAANNGFARTATLSVGNQQFVVKQSAKFADVDPNGTFTPFIEKLSALEITVGCGQDFAGRPLYCPGASVSRDQMSAFIIRALGMSNPPPPALQRFQDVLPSNPFFPFIDQMAIRGITVGCNPPESQVALFCPEAAVTRDQMAAFIIRAVGLTNPPVPASQRFLDVSPSNLFYAFIDQMAARSITMGCDPAGTMYCPSSNVTREQMAAFLVRAFGLQGP